MPIKEIKEYIDELNKDFLPDPLEKKALAVWIEKALKQRTEEVIQAMLVEERKPSGLVNMFFGSGDKMKKKVLSNVDVGFNQCCVLQKEKAKEIKQALTKE